MTTRIATSVESLVRPTCCALMFFSMALPTRNSDVREAHSSSHAWTYEDHTGPTHWGDLKPEFATCKTGHRQSPIDIRGATRAASPALEFHYDASPLTIIDTGHSIQINYAPGSFIVIDGVRYDLRQFHFHHPSEELVNGKQYDMVAHLVHANSEGRLAVVAVLFSKGKTNPVIDTLWQHFPAEKETEQKITGVTVNVADLLPKSTGYYSFEGSLTTPPCSEQVSWFVLKHPVDMSDEQLTTFGKLYPHNVRPIQPLNGRTILEHD